MGLENPGWLSLHPLIKQFPEVLAGVSPLHISVADEGESQICSPGFSLAYSAASALLFQIPAKNKGSEGKAEPLGIHRPQLLHAHRLHWEERSSSLSFSITWLAMLSSSDHNLKQPSSENALELGTGTTNKRAAPAHCPCIRCSQPGGAFTARQPCSLQGAAGVSRPVDEMKQQDPKWILPEQRNILVIPQS